jgi:hypothetical protein
LIEWLQFSVEPQSFRAGPLPLLLRLRIVRLSVELGDCANSLPCRPFAVTGT